MSQAGTRVDASMPFALMISLLTCITSVAAHTLAGGATPSGGHWVGLPLASSIVFVLARRAYASVRALTVVLIVAQLLDHLLMSLFNCGLPMPSGAHDHLAQPIIDAGDYSAGVMLGAHALATVLTLLSALLARQVVRSWLTRLATLYIWLAGSFVAAPRPRRRRQHRVTPLGDLIAARVPFRRGPPAASGVSLAI